MSLFKKIEDWSSTHNPRWLAILRIALGVFLIIRGVAFLSNMPDFMKMIETSRLHISSHIFGYTIAWIHIVGGFCITIGLWTRTACLIQIPILLGAILFVNTQSGIFTFEADLSFSIAVLLLLILFLIEGSGPLSLTMYAKEEHTEEDTIEPPPLV